MKNLIYLTLVCCAIPNLYGMKKTIVPEGLGFAINVEETNSNKISQLVTPDGFMIEAHGLRFTGSAKSCNSTITQDGLWINNICVYQWKQNFQQQKEIVNEREEEEINEPKNENLSIIKEDKDSINEPKNEKIDNQSKKLPIKVFSFSKQKYQQLFFLNIEAPLKSSKYNMFLDFKNFVKAKECLKILDSKPQDLQYTTDALDAILNAQLLMAIKIQDLRLLPTESFEEDLNLFQTIYNNLAALGEKLLNKSTKLAENKIKTKK